ncbi:MAG: hypothetical protein HY360_24235 [Verrucomicrobia bacterium]|nr:hypothetical protein [Verrucomicrobiota bacterium]
MKYLPFLTASAWLLLSQAAFACAACYGATDSATTRAMNMAILCLLGIVVGVLGGVALFILQLKRRSKKAGEDFTPSGRSEREEINSSPTLATGS